MKLEVKGRSGVELLIEVFVLTVDRMCSDERRVTEHSADQRTCRCRCRSRPKAGADVDAVEDGGRGLSVNVRRGAVAIVLIRVGCG